MTTTDISRTYAEQRDRDWESFVSGSGAPADHWARWEQTSSGWAFPIEFIQPLGRDHADMLQPLQPLIEELGALDEVEVPPVVWLHATCLRLGFNRADDITGLQVDQYYSSVAPRLRRVEPFALHLGGLSVGDDERIYLGVDDGGRYREVRRQIGIAVPEVDARMRHDRMMTPEGDRFMPTMDIGYLTGQGDRARVIEALERHRNIDLGEVPVNKVMMARLPIQPYDHYVEMAIFAEIPLIGPTHRGVSG